MRSFLLINNANSVPRVTRAMVIAHDSKHALDAFEKLQSYLGFGDHSADPVSSHDLGNVDILAVKPYFQYESAYVMVFHQTTLLPQTLTLQPAPDVKVPEIPKPTPQPRRQKKS